ncbi:hypothetical protein DHEL01_v201549 [Diaporthe helianthi]|uniref:Uncharacterized protein n=1 Tax=Diaporthe helianthi TaxID=158607 RepID=A0A2P5IC79_DIAHE|nr:hypothetical protein DHEL01_v201549 [Diaporthe helianthi]
MSSTSSLPLTEAKQSEKACLEARAAQLRQQLMRRQTPTATAQPDNTSSSQNAPEKAQRGEQQRSDWVGPVHDKTTAVAGEQSNPGLSRQLPDDGGTLEEIQLIKTSISKTREDSTSVDSHTSSAATTRKLVGTPLPSTPPKIAGNNMNSAMRVVNSVRSGANALSSTNGPAAVTAPDKNDAGACSNVQQRNDSTAKTEQPASHHTTKSMPVPQDGLNKKSSTEEGKMTTKPCATRDKNPIQEMTPQHASSKKTLPTRVSTGTRTVPVKTRAAQPVSGQLETTPAPEQSRSHVDTAPAHASSSRTEDGNRHRRASYRNDRMIWESNKCPQFDHPTYPGDNREPCHRPASPVARRLINDMDSEVERLASHYPDLHDWLEETGWNNPDFRLRHLDRIHRMAEIERARSQLEMEIDRDKARLKNSGEPGSKSMYLSNAEWRPMLSPRAPTRQPGDIERPKFRKLGPYSVTEGLKRKRSEESDDERDGGMLPKYYHTNHAHRGSRAGFNGSYGSRKRGREERRYGQDRENKQGGRSPSSRGFFDGSSSHSLPRRNLRAPYGFPSPASHPLPRNGVEAEHATDWYTTPDKWPRRQHSPRFSSRPPRTSGYFQ